MLPPKPKRFLEELPDILEELHEVISTDIDLIRILLSRPAVSVWTVVWTRDISQWRQAGARRAAAGATSSAAARRASSGTASAGLTDLRQRPHQLRTVELARAGIVVRRIEKFLLDALVQERPIVHVARKRRMRAHLVAGAGRFNL